MPIRVKRDRIYKQTNKIVAPFANRTNVGSRFLGLLELSRINFLDKLFRFKTSPQTCVALKEKESGSSWLLFSCPFTNDTTFLSNVKIRDTLQVIGPVLLTVTLIVT